MRIMILTLLLSIQVSFAETLMVTHKGAWKDHQYPQNTVIGLKRAVDNGFRGIEFDIFKTKDGQFVLGHDDDITKVSTCKGKISEMTVNEVTKCKVIKNTLLPITQLMLKKVKEPQTYTTLNEVVSELFYDDRIEFIWLDLKEQNESVIAALKEVISNITDGKVLDKILINNGSPELIKKMKAELPQVKYSLEGKWGSEPLVDYAKYLNGVGVTHDYVSLNVGIYMGHEPVYKVIGRKKRFWKLLDKFMSEANERGVPFVGWTVNNCKKIQKLKDLGMPILLTDHLYPEKL